MNKAVLVMDMPESCSKCLLCKKMQDKCNYCMATNRIIVDADRKVRWCSLIPIPEKKEKYSLMGDNSAGHVDGWNACIDEILGGGENDNSQV